MQQVGVLHTVRATPVVGAFVRGFQAGGYAVPWDAAAGGMMAIGAADPAPSRCCVVLWTSDAPTSRWVPRYAEQALHRGALVEVLLEKVTSPFENDEPPLDFSDPAARDNPMAQKALWKELIRRIEAKGGQPTGRLPFSKQIEPVALVGGAGFALASVMAIMQPGVQPTSMAVLNNAEPNYADAKSAEHIAMGGPIVAPADLVTARLEQHALKPLRITVSHFEVMPMTQVRVAEAGETVNDAEEIVRPARLRDPS
jgi:hypothetical protein